MREFLLKHKIETEEKSIETDLLTGFFTPLSNPLKFSARSLKTLSPDSDNAIGIGMPSFSLSSSSSSSSSSSPNSSTGRRSQISTSSSPI
ncbi:hypothetical protein Scep_000967 [Stephania cephalantha]|uniref:Uncharacterized protein n=1 Tax=Stephania cephalantha TaxID=152367 RepID=A0AAP0Q788_9MAGN